MYEIALKIATEAHKGQIDKGGNPYINHPLQIASIMENETEKIVALLHDVCEDSETTIEDLKQIGFSKEVIDAVIAITKKENEAYEGYIERVKENNIALKVKLADLEHNSDISRILNPTQKDLDRTRKYLKTIEELKKFVT